MENTHIKLYPILLPFALLYRVVIWIRNLFFDLQLFPSQQYEIPVICVGNLAVGGTGKTPHVEYLVQILCDKYRIAVLSRGYKRKTTGYILADKNSTASDIGDEAYQIKYKYPQVIVAVDKNRQRAMRHLLAMQEDVRPQVVVLDDGFQYRYLQPSFSILITDYNRLFYKDRLLPAGRLREPKKSVSRTDMIVVSKCPEDLKQIDCRIIENEMKPAFHQSLHFTGIKYQQLRCVFPEECKPYRLENIKKEDEIVLITGIAYPALLIEEIKKYSDNVMAFSFRDHHEFSKNDMDKIRAKLSKKTNKCPPLIVFTEKDAARIRHNPYFLDEWKTHCYYLPIQVYFLFNRHNQFEEIIMKHITLMESSRELKKSLDIRSSL